MIARAETATSVHGDRWPSLGRRAKTNKRVPPVALERSPPLPPPPPAASSARGSGASSESARTNETIRKRFSYCSLAASGAAVSKMLLLLRRRTIAARPAGGAIFFSPYRKCSGILARGTISFRDLERCPDRACILQSVLGVTDALAVKINIYYLERFLRAIESILVSGCNRENIRCIRESARK